VSITGPTPAAAEAAGPGQINLKPGDPLIITYAAVSDHLTETPIRIEYRLANDQQWKDIAANQPNTGKCAWQVPDSVRGPFLLRVTAVDLAGNVSPATSLREIEIVHDEPRSTVAGTAGKGGSESGSTIGPGEITMTRQKPHAVEEPPTSMPDTSEVAMSALRQPVLAPTPPKYNDTAPPVRPGGDVAVPGVPKAGPVRAGGEKTEGGVSGEPTASAMDAVGMLVLEYTSPEPASAVKLEPAVARLKAALKPLVDRGMLVAPIGVSRQPLANSANLIKVVQLYAVIPSAQRNHAGDIERDAYENASVALKEGKLEGVMMTRFERAEPTPDSAAVAAGGMGNTGSTNIGGGGTTAVAVDTTAKTNGSTTPNIGQETVSTIVPTAVNTGSLGMSSTVGQPGATSRPAQQTVDDPTAEAGGRDTIALQFGPRQRDLKIKSPPPVDPAPASSGIVVEAPSLPAPTATIDPIAPAPLKDTVTAPTTDVQVAKVDLGLGGPEPVRPPTPTPVAAPSNTPPAGMTEPAPVAPPSRLKTTDVTLPGTVPPAPLPIDTVRPTVQIDPPAAAGNPSTPSASLGKEGVAAGGPVVVASARTHIEEPKLLAAQKAFKDGLAAFVANDRPRAAACYKDAIDNDPEMVEAYINLAGIQTLGQEYDKAELNYQRAVNIQPEHSKALFGLGSVQLLRKNPQMARETLGKLLRIRSDAAAWVLYGDASLAIRNHTSAVSAWKEAIRLAPGTALAKLAQDRLTRYGGASN
jgi:predicted negative regulator of RcsB-dependent stress response